MELPALIETPLRLGLLVAGLLVPGSMLLRALRLPWSLAAALVTSGATLYVAALVFSVTGCPISWATLGSALGLVALLGRLIPARPPETTLTSSFAIFSKLGPWLPLYLVFWAIVAYRLGTQPLSGPDVNFRWSYLAEQMLHFRSLDFYPPRSGIDFSRYFWAESIPPGIASLYAWAYACGGSTAALWTSPVVALQLLAMHEVIWRLASRWGGEETARRAVLLAAACPLLTWSFLIGQETGLTALAVGGSVWCLHHLAETDGRRWAVLAGIFAVAAASTREYGPVLAAAVVATAWLMRVPSRQTWLLATVALPLAAAWPLRVWWLTGNPLYSLDLGGLFPVNRVFVAWSEVFHAPHQAALSTVADWQAVGRYLVLWALPPSAGLIALAVLLLRRLREAQITVLIVALIAGLWWMSVPHTAGGLFYSLRVLSPALALLVVAASYGLGVLFRHPAAANYTAAVVALVLLESLPKTLVLPENPYRITARDWPKAGSSFVDSVQAGQPELVAKLRLLPDHARILTDNAGLPRIFAPLGSEVLPFWSPEAAWLFEPGLKPDEVARRWQKAGFRYLVFGKSGVSADFIRTRARWRAPYFKLMPAAETDTFLILQATVANPTAP